MSRNSIQFNAGKRFSLILSFTTFTYTPLMCEGIIIEARRSLHLPVWYKFTLRRRRRQRSSVLRSGAAKMLLKEILLHFWWLTKSCLPASAELSSAIVIHHAANLFCILDRNKKSKHLTERELKRMKRRRELKTAESSCSSSSWRTNTKIT